MIGRVLVGHPLCRDPDAISLFMRYGSAVPVSGNQISWLPRILRPYETPSRVMSESHLFFFFLANPSRSLLGPHFAASRMQAELSNLIVEDMKHNADSKEEQMVRVLNSPFLACDNKPNIACRHLHSGCGSGRSKKHPASTPHSTWLGCWYPPFLAPFTPPARYGRLQLSIEFNDTDSNSGTHKVLLRAHSTAGVDRRPSQRS